MQPIIFDNTWEFQCGTKAPTDFQMMLNQWKHQYQLVVISCTPSEIGVLRFIYCIARKPL